MCYNSSGVIHMCEEIYLLLNVDEINKKINVDKQTFALGRL